MASILYVICDLDGVVWNGDSFVEGSVEAITQLQREGASVWFVTNNSNKPPSHYVQRLSDAGVDQAHQLLTSAQAAATLIESGERVLICAGPGVEQAVSEAGGVPIANIEDAVGERIDAVIVGLHIEFDYGRLDRAARAVRSGARLIGTNSDITFPTATGEAPGGGAILAAVEAAAGREALLAGKPHAPMAAAVAERVGPEFRPENAVMIGDRYSTDGRFAAELGCRFIAVSSGVKPDDEDVVVWKRVRYLADAAQFLVGDC
ncbi:MAG: HAD-IIA family hydrolase [Ilumatobacteraceae bacterium]